MHFMPRYCNDTLMLYFRHHFLNLFIKGSAIIVLYCSQQHDIGILSCLAYEMSRR